MVESLGRKTKGRYAAPPDPVAERQWWRPIPIYLTLPVTVIFLVIGITQWVTMQTCYKMDSSFCISSGVRPLAYGSYPGLLAFVAVLFVLAIVGMLLAPFMKRWPFWLCWAIAIVAMLLAIVGFLIMSGSFGTPFGGLVHTTVAGGA